MVRTLLLLTSIASADAINLNKNTAGLKSFLKASKSKQLPAVKGDWFKQCSDLSGLISPYYTPDENGSTRVACVPAICDKNFLGLSTEKEIGADAKCTQKGMPDSCCTDKVKDLPEGGCGAGTLPCLMGEVTSLEDYTFAAVDTFNGSSAAAVEADCVGKPGGSGPVDDFKADSAAAMGSR